MSTTTLPREVAEVANIHQNMVFEMISRSTSGFIRKDDVGKVNPRKMNSAKRFDLPVTSRHHIGKGKGYIKTQYVPGADTIYVDDYVDADGKIQSGLKKQGINLELERERAIQMNIHFKFGILDLRQYGEDPMLVEFVNKHEMNAESAAGKNPDRTVSRMFQFQPMRKEEKAAKRTVGFEEQYEAMSIIKALRTKTAAGFEYDVAQVDAIINVLGLKTADLGDSDTAQKFEIILKAASQDGIEFLKIVNDALNSTRLTIAKALGMGIVKISSKGADIKAGEGAQTREVLKFKNGMDESARMQALAIHLLGGSPQAQNDLNTIISEVEIGEISALSKK